MKESDENIEMLSQPLMTEEGFINPACMNELENVIKKMPKTYNRLFEDSEWGNKKDQWTFKHDIIGAFAMCACKQSPHNVPDGLENVCKYLNAALDTVCSWDTNGMAEISLCEINKWLYEILYEQGIKEFDAWNKCKVEDTPDIVFTSKYDGEKDPDRDFIDLDALLRNVCLVIRDERRKNKAFDDEFEKKYGKFSE